MSFSFGVILRKEFAQVSNEGKNLLRGSKIFLLRVTPNVKVIRLALLKLKNKIDFLIHKKGIGTVKFREKLGNYEVKDKWRRVSLKMFV